LFKKLTLEIQAAISQSHTVFIERDRYTIHGLLFENPDPDNFLNKSGQITENGAAEIDKMIRDARIDTWEREYSEWEVLDGYSWLLDLELEDGTIIRSGGQNAYPEGWGHLEAAVKRLTGWPGVR